MAPGEGSMRKRLKNTLRRRFGHSSPDLTPDQTTESTAASSLSVPLAGTIQTPSPDSTQVQATESTTASPPPSSFIHSAVPTQPPDSTQVQATQSTTALSSPPIPSAATIPTPLLPSPIPLPLRSRPSSPHAPPNASEPESDTNDQINLWQTALDQIAKEGLTPTQKEIINSISRGGGAPSSSFIDGLIGLTKDKQDECTNKSWRFSVGGREVVLRDQAEKVITLLKNFKEVGDTLVQYDPGHTAIPWAIVRFVLQARIPVLVGL